MARDFHGNRMTPSAAAKRAKLTRLRQCRSAKTGTSSPRQMSSPSHDSALDRNVRSSAYGGEENEEEKELQLSARVIDKGEREGERDSMGT